MPIEETLSVLDDLIQAGKIRHVGLSNESAWGTMRFITAAEAGRGPRMVSIQNAYNLLNRTFEVLPFARSACTCKAVSTA